MYLAAALAVPLVALRSLVVVRSLPSPPNQFTCIGVQLEDQRILLSAACNFVWPLAVYTAADTSFIGGVSGRIQLGLHSTAHDVTSAAGEDSIVQDPALRVLRVDDLDAPVRLFLPVDKTRPANQSEDANASIIEVDLDTLQVSVLDHVVFLDNSQCHEEPSFSSATSVCVRPCEASGSSVSSSSRRWQFLVTRDASTGKHVLLGLGASASQTQEGGDSRSFTWVHSGILENESPLPAATSDGDRVLGPIVDKIDTHNEFIAGIREDERGYSFCTGALIASRFVLTAAHCTVNHTIAWVSVGAKATSGKSGELLQVRRAIRHPKYTKLPSGMITHDVALLELRKASLRTPIRVGYVHAADLMDKRATIMGYGAKDGAKTDSDELREVEIPLGPANDECAKRMNYTLDESIICGGGEPKKDSCAGDSGGPVVLSPGSSDQRVVATVGLGRGVGSQATLARTRCLPVCKRSLKRTSRRNLSSMYRPPYNPRSGVTTVQRDSDSSRIVVGSDAIAQCSAAETTVLTSACISFVIFDLLGWRWAVCC